MNWFKKLDLAAESLPRETVGVHVTFSDPDSPDFCILREPLGLYYNFNVIETAKAIATESTDGTINVEAIKLPLWFNATIWMRDYGTLVERSMKEFREMQDSLECHPLLKEEAIWQSVAHLTLGKIAKLSNKRWASMARDYAITHFGHIDPEMEGGILAAFDLVERKEKDLQIRVYREYAEKCYSNYQLCQLTLRCSKRR